MWIFASKIIGRMSETEKPVSISLDKKESITYVP